MVLIPLCRLNAVQSRLNARDVRMIPFLILPLILLKNTRLLSIKSDQSSAGPTGASLFTITGENEALALAVASSRRHLADY
jgi:hypothetical protein